MSNENQFNQFPVDYSPYPPQAPIAYRLNLDKLFSDAWNLYKQNFGTMVVLSLIVFGIIGVLDTLSFVSQFVLREAKFHGVSIAVQVIHRLISWIVSMWIGLGMYQLLLSVARGREARYSLLFPSFEKLLKCFGVGIMVLFITYLPLLLVGGIIVTVYFFLGQPANFIPLVSGCIQTAFGGNPEGFLQAVKQIDSATVTLLTILIFSGLLWLLYVTYMSVRFVLTFLFIAERNDGVFNSLGNSWTVTRGNVFVFFIGLFVLGLCSMSGLILCCVGIILTYMAVPVGIVLAYLQLTGQPNICDYQRSSQPSPVPTFQN